MTVFGQPTVGEDSLRPRQSSAQQQRRPVQAVKADDFFADQVHLRRPVAFEPCIGKSDAREVVGERIDPDVNHLVRRARHRNAPAHVASAHRKIRQALCELTQHLVASRFRLHEVGLAHQEFERALVPR